MKMKSLILTGCLMMSIVCPAAFAQDDYNKFDFFAGYSAMKTAEYDNINFIREILSRALSNNSSSSRPIVPSKSNILEKGFSTALTYNLNSTVGIDASLRYNSGFILSASGKIRGSNLLQEENFDAGYKKAKVAFLVGPRFTFRNTSRLTPFVYGLVGLSHDRLSQLYDFRVGDDYWQDEYYEDCLYDDECSDTIKKHNSFGVALGGGFDVSINESWAIRAIQADYFIASHPKYIGNAESIRNKRYDSVNVSLGVVYRFGK